ncbi:MAG TPA: trypsin-like peptidase domain-containing protein [Blastocatellia bacterium]|nr:trypsin-like peptidase domain-containing protein [Blastocatellia bacterium]
MINKGVRRSTGRTGGVASPGHIRTIVLLVGLCCLSTGIAIGVGMRGVASARPDDNRLELSTTPFTPDSLSQAFGRAAEKVERSVVHIKVSQSEVVTREATASGVIVNPAGFIITNQHVVKRAVRIRVKLADGGEFEARVIGNDPQTDLAVIKIDSRTPLVPARMGDSDKLNVGDWVLAIGSPFGLEQTVTAGIISAKDRDIESPEATPFQKFLQTDAAINPGNSGGPLVNLAGEVIGINTQIATGTGVYNGIGLALPSATAVDVYNQLVTKGRVSRGFLGVTPSEMTQQIARDNRISDGEGVLVKGVTAESSPAARAGLQAGDVIVSINGEKVKNVREMIRRIASLPAGSTATILYVRGGRQQATRVKLEERQEDVEERFDLLPSPPRPRTPVDPQVKPESGRDKPKPQGLGLTVRSLTPEFARARGLEGVRGAYVVSVDAGSIADQSRFRPDDVIIEMNDRPITSVEDFLRLTRDLRPGDQAVFRVLRRGRGSLRHAEIISVEVP